MAEADLNRVHAVGEEPLRVQHFEPKVPFRWVPWTAFATTAPPYDLGLARSAGFTPVESDELFDEIRARFIDEAAFA